MYSRLLIVTPFGAKMSISVTKIITDNIIFMALGGDIVTFVAPGLL